MGDYVTVYKRKDVEWTDDEKRVVKQFCEKWEYMSYRTVETWFDIDAMVIEKIDVLALIRDYLEGEKMSVYDTVEWLISDEGLSKGEVIDEIKSEMLFVDFIEDLLWLYMNVRGVKVGSEYWKNDDYESVIEGVNI